MNPYYFVCKNICRLVLKLGHGLRVEGGDKIPREGPLIVAANHASYFDPPIVGLAARGAVHFLARKSLFSTRFSGWLLPRINAIPLDQERGDLASLRRAIQLVRGGKRLVLFPEGERSRNGEILPAQSGVGFLIAKTKAPVLTARIFGAYEAFPRGAKKPRLFTPIRIVIGKQLDFSDEKNYPTKEKNTYAKIAEEVMASIAEIR